MEFEKDAPVSDEQRRLAEVKKMTLQPTRSDVTPEDISESEIASSHINGQPLDTVNRAIKQDAPESPLSDDTTAPVDTPNDHKQSFRLMAIIVGIACILIVASMLFVFAIID